MKRKEKTVNSDSWIFMLLLTTLLILIKSVNIFSFRLLDFKLSYSLFLLPISYFLVDYIAKKYDYKKAIAAISIASVIFVCFTVIMSYLVSNKVILNTVVGEFFSFVVSQFVNLTIYMFLLNNTKSPFILVLFNYIFCIMIYYLIYTLIYFNVLSFDNYWTNFFMTIGIQTGICILLTIVDKRIERGQKKEN